MLLLICDRTTELLTPIYYNSVLVHHPLLVLDPCSSPRLCYPHLTYILLYHPSVFLYVFEIMQLLPLYTWFISLNTTFFRLIYDATNDSNTSLLSISFSGFHRAICIHSSALFRTLFLFTLTTWVNSCFAYSLFIAVLYILISLLKIKPFLHIFVRIL